MLLTLKQPAHHGFKSFHDYSPPTPPSTSRFSPALTNAGPSFPPIPTAAKTTPNLPMSTPHRGLPPPAAMSLAQPSQAPPPLGQVPLSQPMGPLPAPPPQWQGAEESMRNWLLAKAEEDRRRQEEEKTRQEGLRLEQRKIEQDMLRTSLSGGIPPYMIPMVFAGMGGGNLPNASLEWAQHYMAQAHHAQQQVQQQSIAPPPHSSPELRRESRQIGTIYGPPQHPVPAPLPSTPIASSGPPPSAFLPSYPMSPSSRSRGQLPGPGALARGQPSSPLPRLNTGDMNIQPPPQAPAGMQVLPGQAPHPLHQSQSAQQPQQEPQSSPSIYFHHWQPPTSQAGTSGIIQPTTPSDVPSSSPKKRKAQGPQQAAPPPTSQPQYTSPPFSQTGSSVSNTPSTRRRGHSRQRSDHSARGLESYGRPSSRHRHVEGGHGGASPNQQLGYDSAREGASSGHQPLKSERSETQLQAPQHHYEGSFSAGPEMRREERHSAEQERDRERDSEQSSRPSGKRDDMRD